MYYEITCKVFCIIFLFFREEAQKLRKYRGGLLKTTKAGSGNGELLPRDKEKESGSGCPGGRTDRCFLAGKVTKI